MGTWTCVSCISSDPKRKSAVVINLGISKSCQVSKDIKYVEILASSKIKNKYCHQSSNLNFGVAFPSSKILSPV